MKTKIRICEIIHNKSEFRKKKKINIHPYKFLLWLDFNFHSTNQQIIYL